MRKLLALLLVFSMASVASASLSISVHDPTGGGTWDPLNPQDSEITIGISDELILDVHISDPDGIPPFGGYAYALVVNTLDADIGGGQVPEMPDPLWDAKLIGPTAGDDTMLPPQGEEGVGGSLFNLGFTAIPAGTVGLDGVMFHCRKPEGDAVINLYKMSSGVPIDPATDLLDSVTIHQTPEPMTMALLGLGGLGLLRRRRS